MGQLSIALEEDLGAYQSCAFGVFRVLDIRDASPSELLEWLGEESYVALDFETVSPPGADINTPQHFQSAEPVLAALSHHHGMMVLVCPPQHDTRRSDSLWKPFLETLLGRTLIMHNASYDAMFLWRITGTIPERIIDTMVLYGLVTPGRAISAVMRSQSLATAVQVILNYSMDKSVRETFLADRFDYIHAEQCRYAAEDARLTYLLAVRLAQLICQEGIQEIAKLEYLLTPVLLRMQRLGVSVDMEVVASYSERVAEIQAMLADRLYSLLEQDDRAIFALDNGRPVSLKELVHCIRTGDTRTFDALPKPCTDIKRKPGQTVKRTAQDILNLNSSQMIGNYLKMISGYRIVGSDSRNLETYSNALRTGEAALSYPDEYRHMVVQFIETLLRYRAVSKIQSTYLQSWQQLELDGRVHTTYLQTYAESGRISSRHPNLQNCPRPDTTQFLVDYIGEPLDMRGMFVAPEGCVLITADYSQYELRVAAERANEIKMIEVYQREYEVRQQIERLLFERYGLYPWQEELVQQVMEQDEQLQKLLKQMKDLDFHTLNASRIFGKPPEQITRQERSEAKTISFGVLYGMQAKSLAETICRMTGRDMSFDEAQRLLDIYFSTYKNLDLYIKRTIFDALRNGYVASIIGRKRWCDWPPEPEEFGIRSLTTSVKAAVERESVNHTIQATNADATKFALVLFHHRLAKRGLIGQEVSPQDIYPVLTVHDEIVVQCREGMENEIALLLRDCMVEGSVRAGLRTVPTVVEVSIGKTWRK
ncbi:MAG: hypothetical protein KatS3mg023_3602 [Armatimonadota bacterium]|nr:MAG: hypothetical protein KatS3mg023_3602 [Armatimonadota bacterium]